MNDGVSLGPGSEFDAIRQLIDRWGKRAVGIGDDAAVIRLTRGESCVVSVDAAVEGRHFKAGWLSPREIGYRAAVAALSDLAAMAARPVGMLVALAVPAQWRDRLIDLADGIGEATELAGAHIVGGNLTDAGELSITTTVLGEVFVPLRRSGAVAGNHVYVTGRLGGPAAALLALERGVDAGVHRDRFARPVPRLAEARWLAGRGATACIDISDGLVSDARHMAAASQVAIEIDAQRVPAMPGVSVELALRSGEEYELLVAAPGGLDALEFAGRFGVSLTDVGEVSGDAPAGVLVRGADVAAASGYDHFSS